MKVYLKKDVKDLGAAGEVKEVADGYARNYLIPRGLAVPATEALLREVEARRQAQARRAAQEEQAARQQAAKIAALQLVIPVKAGEKGRIYGSVTAADVAAALGRALGQPFDKRKVKLEEPIRHLGAHEVEVEVARGVTARARVEVRPEE
jgi:large subunit ribosomal protein L9